MQYKTLPRWGGQGNFWKFLSILYQVTLSEPRYLVYGMPR